MPTETLNDFESHCRESLDGLRAALIRLYASAGIDPDSPQDVARRFKLNKTLTWKLSKVIGATDNLAAVNHVPGSGAMQIFLKSMASSGAGPEAIDGVRNAAKRFDEMVQLHVGDRPTLELVLDGMAPGATDRLEVSRKLAFRGNSGIWGVQAQTRLALNVLAPNKDNPDTLDIVREWSTGEDAMMTKPDWEPLEEGDSPSVANIMASFSSERMPEIRAEQSSEGTDFVLMPGPVGNFGAIDCYQGELMRSAVSKYATNDDPIGEFGAAISVPLESLVMDIVVEESLAFALEARVIVLGQISRQSQPTPDETSSSALPITDTVRVISGQPPALATHRIERYPEMLELICDRLGCEPRRMRAVRLEMKYPPLGSTVLLRFDLPRRP
eukprot:g5467.t1